MPSARGVASVALQHGEALRDRRPADVQSPGRAPQGTAPALAHEDRAACGIAEGAVGTIWVSLGFRKLRLTEPGVKWREGKALPRH